MVDDPSTEHDRVAISTTFFLFFQGAWFTVNLPHTVSFVDQFGWVGGILVCTLG